MHRTDCTPLLGGPPVSDVAESPAAPRAPSSTARDTSCELAEAGATSVLRNACTWRRSTSVGAWSRRSDSGRRPPGHVTGSSRVFALPSCRYGPESPSLHNGGRFAALGLLGRVVGDEERSPIGNGRRAGRTRGVIPR